MTIKDILELEDISSLNTKELRHLVQQMADAGNKRIKAAQKAGIDQHSPAIKSLQKSGGKISTKGKDLHGLQREFFRAKQFLKSETSTITGFKKMQKDFLKRVGGDGAAKLTLDQNKMFWDRYNKYMEEHPSEQNKRGGSGRVQSKIYDMTIRGKSGLAITRALNKAFREDYEREQKENLLNEQEYSGSGRFFTIDMDEEP